MGPIAFGNFVDLIPSRGVYALHKVTNDLLGCFIYYVILYSALPMKVVYAKVVLTLV